MTTRARRPRGCVETITLGQLLDHKFRSREDLISPWLRQGESVMLWAAPGTGKTLMALTLALMVAGGGSALGWSSPKPRRVLFIDGEMAAEDMQERVVWLLDTVEGIDKEAARVNLHVLSRNWQKPDVYFPDLAQRESRDGQPSDQDAYIALARAHGAELVIADNFATLAEVSDENEASAMTPVLAFLLRLKQARIGCILVHHSGKDGNTYRGSSKLATTFEVVLGLQPLDSIGVIGGAAFKLVWTKYRREPCDAVKGREVRLERDPNGATRWTTAPTEDDDVRILLADIQSGRFTSQAQIAEAHDWTKMRVSRLKRKAIEEGIITDASVREYFETAREMSGEDLSGKVDF